MADIQVPGRGKQQRSSRACQECRTNKTKCEQVPGTSSCSRCLATSSQCYFLASRRGRIKGSKNLRTLKKLHLMQNHETSGAQLCTGGTSTGDHHSESPRNLEFGSVSDCDSISVAQPEINHSSVAETLKPDSSSECRPGTATPWDPNVLALRKEQSSGADRATLARNLLHVLGEFPVHDGKREHRLGDGKGEEESQEPLWLLACLADRGWSVDADEDNQTSSENSQSVLNDSSLDAGFRRLLQKWTPQALYEVEQEQKKYFEYGMFASKCDVASALDPINHGIITDQRASKLFDVYWEKIHPQWSILDPFLHTLASVRQRSALLTTTILALGSTACISTESETQHEHVTEALRLHSHVEKINLVVYATGARSVDIVQAQILLSRWGAAPRSRLEEQRWMRAGMIPRMATEIGLTRPPPVINEEDPIKTSTLWRNDIRTRVFLIINEYRFSAYNGRQALDLTHFELSEEEINKITDDSSARLKKISPVALYDLFLFDRESRQRISRHDTGRHSSIFDAELEHIKTYIEGWMHEWSVGDANPSLNWFLVHEALSCWLLLTTHIAKARLERSGQKHQRQRQHQPQLMYNLAARLFSEAVKVPHAVRTTQRAAIFPFAASILLRMRSKSDLVLQLALHMAGEPGKHYVRTFVREAGVQMLLMLYRNATAKPRTLMTEGRERNLRHIPTDPDTEGYNDKAQKSPMPMEEAIASNSSDYHPRSLPSEHWLSETSLLQPSNIDKMFSFNTYDFPSVPDMSQQYLSLQDPVFRYYDFEDLDALMGISDPPDHLETGNLPPQLCVAQPTPTPTMSSSRTYDARMTDIEMPAHENFQNTVMDWPIEGDPSSRTGTRSDQNGAGEEDRSSQRKFLLSAVDKLLDMASKI